MNIFSFVDFYLNETLKTHDIDLTLRKVKFDHVELLKAKNNTIDATISNINKIDGFPKILWDLNSSMVNTHGWFPSYMYLTGIDNLDNKMQFDMDYLLKIQNSGEPRYRYFKKVTIRYESKYDIEFEVPSKLYHLSIKNNKIDILKRGILPKSKNKISKHLDRIYVCSSIEKCKELIKKMKYHYSNKYPPNILKNMDLEWVIFEISTERISKLYKDPNYNGGFYLIENIPPIYIKVAIEE
jgi:hypothetical protein